MKNMKKIFLFLICIVLFASCMSEKFLESSDYDDIVAVYDSISFRIWRDSDKSNALIKLIQLERTEEALFLIENNAFRLNYVNKQGETALSEAVATENADIIISLMEHGASINNENAGNPLFIAVMTGNTTIFETLLNNGADIDGVDENGNNVFHYTISSKRPEEMISYLLSKHVDIESRNLRGETPLYYALKSGDVNAAALLIKRGADLKTLDNSKQNIYFAAIESKSKATLEFVHEYNKDVDCVNINNETPLLSAITINDPEFVKRLLDFGADIEKQTKTTPLWHAFDQAGGNTECLKVLAERGVNLNKKNSLGETVLVRSIKNIKDDLAIAFIQWGADVNVADSNGSTPIQLCVQTKNNKLLSFLIGANADLLVRDNKGMTLLHTCVESNSRETLDILLESKKIQIDYPTPSGVTAAMLAFQTNKPELGDYLIEKGASLSAQDKSGKTLVAYRVAYYQRQIDSANKQIATNENTITALRNQNSAASQKISSLRVEEQKAYNNYVSVNNEYEEAKRKQDSLERQVNSAKDQMNYWDSRVTWWTNQYNSATTPALRSSANSGLSQAKSNYNDYRREYNSKNSELLGLSIANAGKAIASTVAYAAYTKISKQINEQNSLINSNNSRITKLNSENSTLTQDIRTYQKEITRY